MPERTHRSRLSIPHLLSGGVVVRLTVTSSALIVSVCVLLSAVLVYRLVTEMRHNLERRGRTIAEFLAREAELGVLSGNVNVLRKLGETAQQQPDVVYSRFFDRDRQLLVAVDRRPQAATAAAATPPTNEDDPLVWEVEAPITTVNVQRRREEVGFDSERAPHGPAGTTALSGPEPVGAVAVGMALGPYYQQRRTATLTAVAFTAGVTLLAALSAALLTWGPLRALASATELAEERGRVAELKGRFVTMASHEFRTPLAVILSCADVLRRYTSRLTPEQRLQRLHKIQTAVRQMTDLLEDVLAVGRADAGKLRCNPEPVEVELLCQEVIADVRVPETHTVQLSVDGAREESYVDRKLVRQIVRNLLVNAVKYSPAGGTIALALAHRNGTLRIQVTDQGIGIPRDALPHLFEPFHRAENVGTIPGSGLGLAITHGAVQAHGGTISVDSTVGRGTTFVVELPCRPAEPGVEGPFA